MSDQPQVPARPPQALLSGQIPHSVEAEEAVIGAVLVNPDAFTAVASFLTADSFYILRHSYIWEALKRLSDRESAIDYLTLSEELRATGRLSEIGGSTYLTQIISSMPTSMNAWHYGKLVEAEAVRRRMLAAADEIRGLALDHDNDASSQYFEGMARYSRIQPTDREHYLPGALSQTYYDERIRDLAARRQRGEMIGFPLPDFWDRLREALPMVLPGQLVVISGPSGSGKSALCETWAEWLAGLKVPVYYAHTEMSTDDLLHRRAARHSRLTFYDLASGNVDPLFGLDTPGEAIAAFKDYLDYDWLPDVSFDKLAQNLRRAADAGAKALFLDHFQDVTPPDNRGDSQRALEFMCVWLAAFCEKRGVNVFVASQENASGQTKWTKKLIEKAVIWLSIKRFKLKSEFIYTLNEIEYRAQASEDSPKSKVSINKARFGKRLPTEMLYHGPAFCWLDLSRVTLPPAQGKIISLDEIKAREQAKQVISLENL